MKSIILNLFILFYLSQTNAQARIGSTESEIRAEFSEKSFKSGYDKDGDKWISMETDISTVRYYFNAKNDWKCFITQVIPDNQGALNSMVERYNKQYVIISETEWRIYGKNGIMRIKLIFEDGGGYYFIMGSN